ncbi:MAG: hypothetical protein ACREOI_31735 [bacterium]
MKSKNLVLIFAATLSGCALRPLVKPESLEQKLVKPRPERATTDIERAAVGRPTVIEPVSGEKSLGNSVDNPGSCIKRAVAAPEIIPISEDGSIVLIKDRHYSDEEFAIGVVAGNVVFVIPVFSAWSGMLPGFGPMIITDGPAPSRHTTF